MAENFLVQHSILRSSGDQSCQSNIYYNYDDPRFIQNLNGVTKFMLVLGTFQLPRDNLYCKESNSYSFHFTHFNQALLAKNIVASNKDDHNLIISKSSLKDLQIETISPYVPTEKRFITRQALFPPSPGTSSMISIPASNLGINENGKFLRNDGASVANNDICVHSKGIIGSSWPTVQRGQWFPNVDDVKSFRQKIAYLCPCDESFRRKHQKSKLYKLVIYQRDLSRKLIDQEDAIRLIQEKLLPADWEIVVIMHVKDRSPCEIAHLLNDVDVLVTRRPAVLFEIFPYRYYKRAYGPLSKEYGIIHGGSMSTPLSWLNGMILSHVKTKWCMENKYCRGFARNTDVKLSSHGVNRLVELVELYLQTINGSSNDENIDSLYKI